MLAATQFTAREGNKPWSYQGNLHFTTGVAAKYEAQIQLPAGAVMDDLECFFYDLSAVNDATVSIYK